MTYLKDFTDIDERSYDKIDIFLTDDFHQTISINFQNPFGKV